jgi:hypothetical protein
MTSRGRFATPAGFLPQDCSSYRGLHVRRKNVGVVPRSRAISVAPRQTLFIRFAIANVLPGVGRFVRATVASSTQRRPRWWIASTAGWRTSPCCPRRTARPSRCCGMRSGSTIARTTTSSRMKSTSGEAVNACGERGAGPGKGLTGWFARRAPALRCHRAPPFHFLSVTVCLDATARCSCTCPPRPRAVRPSSLWRASKASRPSAVARCDPRHPSRRSRGVCASQD